MPNDNTHTLKPCPWPGRHTVEFVEYPSKGLWGVSFYDKGGSADGLLDCRADSPEEAARIWNTRTPAEPKAGDWEQEVEIHTAVEIHDRFQDDGIGDTEYVRLDEARALSSAASQPKAGDWEQKLEPFVKSRLAVGESAIVKVTRLSRSTFEQYEPSEYRYELIRALSSAAPRITEEMVEGIAAELLEAYGKWVPDYRHAIADMKEAFLALLRQPPPFTPTQTEE